MGSVTNCNEWSAEISDAAIDAKGLSIVDRQVMERWDSVVHRDDDGHYVLPIPFKDQDPALPESRAHAVKRLESLCKRLQKSEELRG